MLLFSRNVHAGGVNWSKCAFVLMLKCVFNLIHFITSSCLLDVPLLTPTVKPVLVPPLIKLAYDKMVRFGWSTKVFAALLHHQLYLETTRLKMIFYPPSRVAEFGVFHVYPIFHTVNSMRNMDSHSKFRTQCWSLKKGLTFMPFCFAFYIDIVMTNHCRMIDDYFGKKL